MTDGLKWKNEDRGIEFVFFGWLMVGYIPKYTQRLINCTIPRSLREKNYCLGSYGGGACLFLPVELSVAAMG